MSDITSNFDIIEKIPPPPPKLEVDAPKVENLFNQYKAADGTKISVYNQNNGQWNGADLVYKDGQRLDPAQAAKYKESAFTYDHSLKSPLNADDGKYAKGELKDGTQIAIGQAESNKGWAFVGAKDDKGNTKWDSKAIKLDSADAPKWVKDVVSKAAEQSTKDNGLTTITKTSDIPQKEVTVNGVQVKLGGGTATHKDIDASPEAVKSALEKHGYDPEKLSKLTTEMATKLMMQGINPMLRDKQSVQATSKAVQDIFDKTSDPMKAAAMMHIAASKSTNTEDQKNAYMTAADTIDRATTALNQKESQDYNRLLAKKEVRYENLTKANQSTLTDSDKRFMKNFDTFKNIDAQYKKTLFGLDRLR
jgi:hypothetical protein